MNIDLYRNLRTWPWELVDWPVANSQRMDVWLDKRANRNMAYGQEGLRVLPANERTQLRWNSDVYDLDGGSGLQEGDPGAWLLPYWAARYFGLLGGPVPAIATLAK